MYTMALVNSDFDGLDDFGITDTDAKALGKKLAERNVWGQGINSVDLAAALKIYDAATRQAVVAAYQTAGGDAAALRGALQLLTDEGTATNFGTGMKMSTTAKVWGVLSTLSAAASGFHGYRRNNSLGWGVGWFILGGICPVLTPTVAVAQGFGKPKR